MVCINVNRESQVISLCNKQIYQVYNYLNLSHFSFPNRKHKHDWLSIFRQIFRPSYDREYTLRGSNSIKSVFGSLGNYRGLNLLKLSCDFAWYKTQVSQLTKSFKADFLWPYIIVYGYTFGEAAPWKIFWLISINTVRWQSHVKYNCHSWLMNWHFSNEKLWYFPYSYYKHRLWTIVRTASVRWF